MNRRHFLQHSMAGAVLPAFMNGFSVQALGSALAGAAIDNDNVLVIIQLQGGNDGLNMVVPIDKYDAYKTARGAIALPKEKLLPLVGYDKAGLHPAMTGLARLQSEGKVRLIQSVSYPSPNFSHFRATDIWNTGSESNQYVYTGWAGRYFSYFNPNYPTNYPNKNQPDPLAIQIGSFLSPIFQGPAAPMGMAISNPTSFFNLISGKPEPVPDTPAGSELSFLRDMATQTNAYATVIKDAAAKVPTQYSGYPTGNPLADQLKIVARLIAGGLKTKMYMVNLGGFDTHANQTDVSDPTVGQHALLMGRISGAVDAFMTDLKQLGVSKKVMGMTYSEFGRRIKANSSYGTDHGSAAPMFMFGDLVQPGVSGDTPNLPISASVNDNIPMQFDYRQVYTTILQEWFCMTTPEANAVTLDKSFGELPLVQGGACGKITATEPLPQVEYLTNYPNPFQERTTLQFEAMGGLSTIEIFNLAGASMAVPVSEFLPRGQHVRTLDTGGWVPGMYLARLTTGDVRQVRKLVKQ